jgi:phosphotransferase system  glucose/maltose/N-acetylglucosamine-specific IIC component
MGYVLLGLFFCIIVAVGAYQKGRNPIVWFIVSVLITPILAAIILLIIGKSDKKKLEEVRTKKELESLQDK